MRPHIALSSGAWWGGYHALNLPPPYQGGAGATHLPSPSPHPPNHGMVHQGGAATSHLTQPPTNPLRRVKHPPQPRVACSCSKLLDRDDAVFYELG